MFAYIRQARLPLPALALFALSLASTFMEGCYTQPYDWYTTWGSTTGPFTTSGYTDIPNATVAIEMKDSAGVWRQVATTQSAATPTYSMGAWSSNSPALYYFGTTVTPNSTSWWDGKLGTLRMRNVTSNTTLYGGNSNSLSCFLNTISQGADFYSVAWNCGYSLGQVTIDNGNIR